MTDNKPTDNLTDKGAVVLEEGALDSATGGATADMASPQLKIAPPTAAKAVLHLRKAGGEQED